LAPNSTSDCAAAQSDVEFGAKDEEAPADERQDGEREGGG